MDIKISIYIYFHNSMYIYVCSRAREIDCEKQLLSFSTHARNTVAGGGGPGGIVRAAPGAAPGRGRQRLRRGVALKTQNQNIAVPPGSGNANTSSPNSKSTAYGENDYLAGLGWSV